MLGAGAVDETARHVNHRLVLVKHLETAAVRHIGDMRHLEVFFMTVSFKLFPVAGVYYHGHPLLRFGYCKFRRIQAAVFDRNPVKIYPETFGEFAYGHAYTPGAEIVGLLDQARSLRPSEKPLQFAFLRGVSFLYLGRTLV